MKRLTLVLCFLAAFAPALAAPGKVTAPAPAAVARQPLRSADLLQNLNKQMTLEGFYYDGSIPMIINDMELLRQDKILPADAYVPITGPRPSGLKWGDRISVTGMIEKPAGLSSEAAAIRVSGSSGIRLVGPATARFQAGARLSPAVIKAVVNAMKAPYAILIAGGASPANNHIRYWNDLLAMYTILTANGYPADHITVIYADGSAKGAGMPVNYSASKANIATAFSNLAAKVGPDNAVYIMLNDHGAVMDGGHVGLDLWYDKMSDAEFAAQVNKITQFKHMLIQMKQCYSGGFVDDLTGPNRVVMSSCRADQVSWAKLTLDFGEFTYWYMSALKGSFVDGTGPCNADKSGDQKISIAEAWNFAREHDKAPEVPQYEDSGAAPCASGAPMPIGNDGLLGRNCWLN